MKLLHGLVDLDADPSRLAFLDGEHEIERGALASEVGRRAELITELASPDCRVGVSDTGDWRTMANILGGFAAERSVVLLPYEDERRLRLLERARCSAVLKGDEVERCSWELRDEPLPHQAPRRVAGSSPEAVVLFTSGSTSEPKGVCVSQRNIASNLTAMTRVSAPWQGGDRLGLVLPLTHSFGLSMALMALARQSPAVFLGSGTPSRSLAQTAERCGVSVFACVPYYLRLVERRGMRLGREFLPGLRALYLAGGGMSDDEQAAILAEYDGLTYLMYGLTEATARVAVRRRGDGAPPNSVGLPLPGTSVDIVSESGEVVPEGVAGLIRVSSPSLMIGYLGEPPRIDGSPWMTTDLGHTDGGGHLYITGRQAEMLNFRGNRVSAVVVERAVSAIDGVSDARLIPDATDEDAQCTLLIVAEPDADHSQLRRAALRVIDPRGLVREITFVDGLEFTRSGKPIRRMPAVSHL